MYIVVYVAVTTNDVNFNLGNLIFFRKEFWHVGVIEPCLGHVKLRAHVITKLVII